MIHSVYHIQSIAFSLSASKVTILTNCSDFLFSSSTSIGRTIVWILRIEKVRWPLNDDKYYIYCEMGNMTKLSSFRCFSFGHSFFLYHTRRYLSANPRVEISYTRSTYITIPYYTGVINILSTSSTYNPILWPYNCTGKI